MALASKIELPERYRVARHIASGGMASVWEAEDLLLGRIVAVKVLAAQYAADPGARARFQREARTAAQVSDQSHVVTIFDIGEHNNDAFIVMEYFAGGTVADRLRSTRDAGERVPRETAMRWLREAASGLDVAHDAGIVHRDVKPANLLLDAQDRCAVADFGIARLADDTQMTQTGQVLGTAAYISPEQALGRPATPASDRYALAVVAYELLTGSRPFTGGPPTAQALQHAQSQPPLASAAAPELPKALDAVLERGLAKDPEGRPRTASELVSAIQSALDGGAKVEPTQAIAGTSPTPRLPTPPVPIPVPVPPRRIEPVAAPPRRIEPDAAPSRPSPQPPPGEAPRPRRSPSPAILAAIVFAGAVVALVLALSSGGDPKQSAERRSTQPTAERAKSTTTAAPSGQSETPAKSTPSTSTQGASPTVLARRGHDLVAAGDHAQAVEPLRAAVEGLRPAGGLPYAFALYDLGVALNRSGNPEEAVTVLQERLKIPNQTEVVQAELDNAQAKLDGPAANGNGKGSGKGNGKKGDEG